MTGRGARILIVDDEVAQMRALCDTLEYQGYATTGFASARAALAAMESNEFDVVLTDLKMPEMDGIEFLASAHRIDPNVVGVVMTGHGTVDTAVDAMKAGSIDYLLKPFKLAAITAVLTRALAVRRLRVENLELKEAVSIYDLSMSLASVLDSHVVPVRVADAAMRLPHAAGVCVLLAVSRGRELQLAACRGVLDAQLATQRIPIDAAFSDWIARSRERMSSPDWLSANLPTEHPLRHIIKGLAVPMFAGGTLVGILGFASTQQRSVKAGQIKALTLLANTAATAIDAALLVEEMEERVADRTAELKAANEELDAFSHSVSHDLRAPLRAIEGYCDMLAEEHAAQLPADAQRLFSNVHTNARRMSALIQDLLAFSRYTREPLKHERVDMRALAMEVWRELSRDAQQPAEIAFHSLPVCMGDTSLLRQVWINLLSNASKYSQHRSPACIEVGIVSPDEQHTGEHVFFVRDNGAGFDMKQADRLFGVFQRLHDASQFEGTGVGLSIVRRIVVRHGGRIWAEGAIDQGATFYFSLPCTAAVHGNESL